MIHMEQTSSLREAPQDHAVLRSTLLKLTATQKILCTVVVVVVALVWYALLKRLVAFGEQMDYSGLQVLGNEAIGFLQRYNTFFWWALVALITLILIYILTGFVQSSRRRVRSKIVSASTFHALVSQMSEAGREVLRWSWQDRTRPVDVGVLQHAAAELRSGRASKIALSRQQAEILDETAPVLLARPQDKV